MKRPWLLRYTPEAIRGRLWYRLYRRRGGYEELFKRAPLDYADGVSMIDLVPSDYISQCVAFLGYFEPWLSRRMKLLASAPGGRRLVDVGANMGYFSLIWLAANQDNSVIAFEPGPRNLGLLRANLTQNHFAGRCAVYALACAHENGTVRFDSGPSAQTGWGSMAVTDVSRTIEIPAVRIDETITDSRPIDLLKIDTEGADFLVLRGAERMLRKKQIREIVFEMNLPGMKVLGISVVDISKFLSHLGYVAKCVESPNKLVSTWCAVPA